MSTFCVRTQTLIYALKHIFRIVIRINTSIPMGTKNAPAKFLTTKPERYLLFYIIFCAYSATHLPFVLLHPSNTKSKRSME